MDSKQIRMNCRNAYLAELPEVVEAEAKRRFNKGSYVEAAALFELLAEMRQEEVYMGQTMRHMKATQLANSTWLHLYSLVKPELSTDWLYDLRFLEKCFNKKKPFEAVLCCNKGGYITNLSLLTDGETVERHLQNTEWDQVAVITYDGLAVDVRLFKSEDLPNVQSSSL